MTILIVDDDPNIRRMMRLTLEGVGAIQEAGDGPAALAAIRDRGPIDVVIVDQKLPGMSGLELIPEIRRSLPVAPIIMVTAYASLDLAGDAMRAGARHFLCQPLTPDVLRAAVRSAGAEQAPTDADDITGRDTETMTINGYRVALSGQPVRVDRDGSALHTFLVAHAFGGWTRSVRVRIDARAFRRSAHPDAATGSRLAHLVAARVLAAHLFREGLLPEGNELRIAEVDAAHLAAALRQAAGHAGGPSDTIR